MDGCMDGWMDGWLAGWLDGWMTEGSMDKWMAGWRDGWRDAGIDGWRDGGMVGWRDGGVAWLGWWHEKILRMEGRIEEWRDEMMLGVAVLTTSLLHCFRDTRSLVARAL